MGRLCARQSNIPRPPFPSRNRLDEVHAARSAQTICAFRRGGCHPPAGRTLCAPTLRVLFLGRVELQGEVRDMGPGRRCHAADWAHGRVDKPSDSGQTRFGLWPSLGSAHPFPTYLPYAPILRASLSRCGSRAAGSLSLRLGLVSGPPCGPLRLSSARKWYHAPIGRAAGSITPTTPPKPTRA